MKWLRHRRVRRVLALIPLYAPRPSPIIPLSLHDARAGWGSVNLAADQWSGSIAHARSRRDGTRA